MGAWMALVTILGIVAIVGVMGGLVAFVGHMVIGVFDRDRVGKKSKDDIMEYTEYKQANTKKDFYTDSEYDFDVINQAKAQREMEQANQNIEDSDDIFALLDDDDSFGSLEVATVEKQPVPVVREQIVKLQEKKIKTIEPVKVVDDTEDELDDFDFDGLDDLDSLIDEISQDVIEEEKNVVAEEVNTKIGMSEQLKAYSIDNIMNAAEEETEETEEFESEKETYEEIEEYEDETEEYEEIIEPVKTVIIKEDISKAIVEDQNRTINDLKAQLEELNRRLETARTPSAPVTNESSLFRGTNTTVVIDKTEEQCVIRLELLEERLKSLKSDYKANLKEYKPLEKVKRTLERDKAKLRRKEAIAAKKKVALYGVNNYVDIDKEKAEKLANELELLDGLRLSVNHCEEVMNANKDRYPILEHANKILEEQMHNLKADIQATQIALEKIRAKRDGGNGENK